MSRIAYSAALAEVYDDRHFGGRSGRLVFSKDCMALASLLPAPGARVLDVPCGTGPYLAAFRQRGYRIVGADASMPMLAATARSTGARVAGDIVHLPFPNDAFDATMTLRLFSHFDKAALPAMLRELRRVIAPGGRVIFDTFRWSPRQWPVFDRFLDPRCMAPIRPADVESLIAQAGLTLVDARWRYLFSPIWQRRLPYWALRGVTALEARLPPRWLLRTFWACTK